MSSKKIQTAISLLGLSPRNRSTSIYGMKVPGYKYKEDYQNSKKLKIIWMPTSMEMSQWVMTHHPKKYYEDIKQNELKLCQMIWWKGFSWGIVRKARYRKECIISPFCKTLVQVYGICMYDFLSVEKNRKGYTIDYKHGHGADVE